MASSTASTGSFEHQLQTRLVPAVERAVDAILVPKLAPRIETLLGQVTRLREDVKGVGMTANVILSSQEIARQFEITREQMQNRAAAHEQRVADLYEQTTMAIAESIAEHETNMEKRIAALEALTLGTLLRLMARRIFGL